MTSLYSLILTIVALVFLVVVLVGWEIKGRWLYMRNKTARALHEMYSLEQTEALALLPKESLAHKLLGAGFDLSSEQFWMGSFLLGIGVCALSWWLFLPGVPAVALGLLAGAMPLSVVNDRYRQRGAEIDKWLPIALSRIASGLQTGHGLSDVLETVGRSLVEDSKNPLSPELIKTSKDILASSAEKALMDLSKRSSSLSLSNVAMLLLSYHRAGGGQYVDVVVETAQGVQRLIAIRNHAAAKASQAMQTAKIIPAILAVIVLTISKDPSIGSSLSNIVVQIGIAIAIGVMAIGYRTMRNETLKVA